MAPKITKVPKIPKAIFAKPPPPEPEEEQKGSPPKVPPKRIP